jgi:hypothetical protein
VIEMTKQEQSDPLIAIRSFLKFDDFKSTPQADYWRWLVDNAKLFKNKPLNKKELKKVKELLAYPRVGMLPRAKMCFYFNQVACLANQGEFEYWEGQAIGCAIPVEHAWLVYNGKVVDAVWGTLDHIQTPDGYSAGAQQDYAGVKIPYDLVRRSVASGIASSLIMDYYLQSTAKF